MEAHQNTRGGLTGNGLKLIAAGTMLADHAGLLLFPGVLWLRIVGRLAFPIYAYMIAQGCRYTRSPLRYFLQIFSLAAVCQLVYFLADGTWYFSILVTFSISILLIFLLDWVKGEALAGKPPVVSGAVFLLAVALVWQLNQAARIDYGFWGCMVPVFPAAFQLRQPGRGSLARLDRKAVHLGMLALALVLLAWDVGGIQFWSLAALIPLALYNGRRGRRGMKYFFYIFYPAHLAVLQGIQWLVFWTK